MKKRKKLFQRKRTKKRETILLHFYSNKLLKLHEREEKIISLEREDKETTT